MKLLHSQKIHRVIRKDFFYSFETNGGIYLIEVIAKAKSWWQNLKKLKSFFKDDGIILSLDNTEIFTSNSKDNDVKAIWNGNELKGLSKTVLIAIILKKGGHTLRLRPDQNPSLESVKIMEVEKTDNYTAIYSPSDNNPPEKGDRRPWISYVLQNIAIKKISIAAVADKRERDDEDIKLVIDGKTEENTTENAHKDWYWCGKILKGKEAVFKKETNFNKGKHSIELWSDGSPKLNKIEVSFLSDNNNGNEYDEEVIRPYKYKGVLNNEDYNRYDAIITGIVAFWNNEFKKDTDPPPEPLDPNLVKAIIYQESRMGFDETAGVNVMQVGNEGDPSILTLRGELPEYWIHNGQLILLKYDAKVESVKDSINWGVRWLYHKAQGATPDNKRFWRPWRDALFRYGPGEQEYVDGVWGIYKKGIKKEINGTIRLWSIILLALVFLFGGKGEAHSLDARINDQIIKEQNQAIEGIELSYSRDKKYFLAQIEQEKDWWEKFRVGRLINEKITWLPIDKPIDGPFGEQAILSAKFIDLKEFDNPIAEVYGLTHAGHGYLYIYEIQNDELNLLFATPAVDYNPDTRWAPGNFEKYGYRECGEIFSNGKLTSEYKDINKDGASDLILSGTKEIICEERDEYYQNASEIKAGSIQIEKKILWNKNKHTWIDTANDAPKK